MRIGLSDVVSSENKEITREVPIELEMFSTKLGSFPIVQKTPIALTITNRENKRLLIRGDVNLTVMIPCARCLKEVPTEFCLTVDKEFGLEDSVIKEDEAEENDYLIGLDLDIDKLIYGEILVSWPMRVLCREDCKGICKVCGKNLNEGDCSCRKTEPDPRMAAIQDVFNKFKEV